MDGAGGERAGRRPGAAAQAGDARPAEAIVEESCETDYFDPEKVQRLQGATGRVGRAFEIFKVLGDETRTKIAYLLAQEELCVHDLAALLGLSPSAVSHHLRLLRTYRIVRPRREGKIVYYKLDDAHIVHLIEVAREHAQE